MKVRHIRRKPWLIKGPAVRAEKRRWQAERRVRQRRRAEFQEACRAYMRPVLSVVTGSSATHDGA